MSERISWTVGDELAQLLSRYYRGEAEHWPAIQAHVHAALRERGLPVGPRHIRFRRIDAGYVVIVEDAHDIADL